MIKALIIISPLVLLVLLFSAIIYFPAFVTSALVLLLAYVVIFACLKAGLALARDYDNWKKERSSEL